MKVITPSNARVLFEIWKHGPINPTSLGLRLGYDIDTASTSVRRALKTLVEQELVSRNEVNKRVVTYACDAELRPFIISGRGANRDEAEARAISMAEAVGARIAETEEGGSKKIVRLMKSLESVA